MSGPHVIPRALYKEGRQVGVRGQVRVGPGESPVPGAEEGELPRPQVISETGNYHVPLRDKLLQTYKQNGNELRLFALLDFPSVLTTS